MFDILSALSGGFASPGTEMVPGFFLRVFCGESVVEGSSRKGLSVVVSEQNCGDMPAAMRVPESETTAGRPRGLSMSRRFSKVDFLLLLKIKSEGWSESEF